MQVKDELRVLVEAEVARAIENFKKLSGGIDESEQKSLSLGEALDSLSKKSLIISGVIGGAGIAAIKFAGENEKLKLSLKNMLGSADEASAVFEEWRRLGSSPGLSSDEVFSLGKAMVNMGHDTEYATSTMTMLGNVAAGTGVSFSEISSSFERTRAVGNLTSRDLVKLQQQGIPIVKQLAKEMGVSEESVRSLAANGKISFADFERALKSMTVPGGQFAGMMDELSGTVLEKFSSAADDAKQALASFGEMLLPLATDVLSAASSFLTGISELDEGTKKIILGLGGLVVVSGPAITAIKGIGSALAFLTANPIILGIAGVAAGLGLIITVFSDVNKKLESAAKDYDMSLKSMAKSNQDLIRNGNFAEVSRQIRGLSIEMHKAAVETGNYTAAAEAAQKVIDLQRRLDYITRQADDAARHTVHKVRELVEILERPINPNYSPTSWVDEELDLVFASESRKFEVFFDTLRATTNREVRDLLEIGNEAWGEAIASKSSDAMIQVLKNLTGRTPKAQAEIDRLWKEISELNSGKTITPLVTVTPPSVTNTSNTKKRWEEWFGEITNVDPSLFGDSGAKAAELYIADFKRGLTAQESIAEALGEELDIAKILRSRQADVQNALVELLSIDPSQINMPFEILDASIQGLINSYEELGEKAKKIEDTEGILKKLREEVRGLKEDQYELAIATMTAAGATAEQIEEARKLIKEIKELKEKTDELKFSYKEFFGNMAQQFASISLSSLNTELSAIGEAFAKGEFAAENLTDALANMALQILNQLPNMFLQAGLQLISQGQWPLGLGFIVAAGASSLVSGYVNGKVNVSSNSQGNDYHVSEITPNAHGNAFNAFGIVPYAHGGAFTNQIVNRPTYFRYGDKFGVMGEDGPESIMPLRRMSNGDLGVAASGGGAEVTVNIINNSGADVRKEETERADGGKDITVIIGDMINNHILSGGADRPMTRFGVHPKGV